jgi:hypothetical protein
MTRNWSLRKNRYWLHDLLRAQCLVILFFMVCLSSALAQEVNISSLQLQPNGDVYIYYDLTDEQEDRKYALYLYSSGDNFIQPLEKVDGEIGVDLSVGKDKRIIWHAKEELGEEFKGSVALELKGRIYVPFIALDGFEDYKAFKKGKEYELTWTGGRGDNILIFELYKANEKIMVFDERPNVGNTTMVFPKDVKSGEYRFKISDSRNRDEVVFTDNFQVKRKVPLFIPIAAGAVVGVGVYFVLNALNPAETEEAQIGDPPAPKGN